MTFWPDFDDRLPYTWAGAFYATIRALCILVAYVVTLAVLAFVILGLIGMQLQ